MSRDKFLRIKKYFHVADNQNLEKGNKVVKVAYLYKIMNEKLSQWQIFHMKLSIDESMASYFGKHSAKMYIKASRFVLDTKYGLRAEKMDIPIS